MVVPMNIADELAQQIPDNNDMITMQMHVSKRAAVIAALAATPAVGGERAALAEAVRLYENYGLLAGHRTTDVLATGRWINQARAILAAQPASPLREMPSAEDLHGWACVVRRCNVGDRHLNHLAIWLDGLAQAQSASPPEQPAADPVGREALDRAAFQLFLLDNNASRWPSVNQDQYRREAKSILDAAFPTTAPDKEIQA
jgi:hypothetical protein